jgi:predicted Zn-dependent protease
VRKAVSELRHVAAAQPDNDRVHYLLAGAYAKQGDRSHAQAELAEYQRLTRSRLQNTQQDVKNLSDSLNHP